jgi:hypothetical protein
MGEAAGEGSVTTPDLEAYAIVFDEAKRALEHQSGSIDELRGRAGVLFGAASIAASFLGGIALDDGTTGTAGIVGIIAFVAVGVLSSVILWPYDWRFIFSAEVLISGWVEAVPPAGLAELRRDLARLMEGNRAANQRKLGWLWKGYQAGILTLMLMIGAWMLELARVWS